MKESISGLVVLLFLIAPPLAAQPNFSRIYLTEDRAFSSGSSIHAIEEEYFLGTHTVTFQPDVTVNPKFITVNSQGIETWSHEIEDLGFKAFVIPDNVLLDGNRYCYARLTCQNTGTPQFTGLLSYDIETQLYDFLPAHADVNLATYGTIRGEQDSLLSFIDVVNDTEQPEWSASIIYHDLATNTENHVGHSRELYNIQPGEIRRLPDGNILMTFHAWDETSPNTSGEPRFGILRKISPLGEILWTRKFKNEDAGNHIPSVLPLPNGDIAYGWTKDSFTLTNPIRLYAYEPVAVYFLDSLGEVKTYTMLGPERAILNTMKLLRNGDILGMGRTNGTYDGRTGDIAWAFRLSSNGDVLWKKKIHIADHQRLRYDLTDAIEAENGDLLFTGTCPVGESSSAAWLLKLSADGCYDPADYAGDTIRIIEEVVSTRPQALPVKVLKVSPNPATDLVRVELEGVTGTGSRRLELLDALGRLVVVYKLAGNATTIDVSNVAAGVYYLSAQVDGVAYRGKVVIVE